MKKTRVVPKDYSLKVIHWRRYYGVSGYQHKSDMNGSIARPRAGLTEAFIFDKEGKLASYGEAKCGKRDNFSKKIGRDIAIGRALKKLERNKES